MNDFTQPPAKEYRDRAHEPGAHRAVGQPPKVRSRAPRRWRGRLLGLGVLLLLVGALGAGTWRHYAQARAVAETAEQRRNFVPNVRVATVQPSGPNVAVTLPATTLAFTSANIYAR